MSARRLWESILERLGLPSGCILATWSAQDASRSAPRAPKTPPRAPRERPRHTQERPRDLQDSSKSAQEARPPKKHPRHAQERPRCLQDRPKSAQDASKTTPRAPKLSPRCLQDGSGRLQNVSLMIVDGFLILVHRSTGNSATEPTEIQTGPIDPLYRHSEGTARLVFRKRRTFQAVQQSWTIIPGHGCAGGAPTSSPSASRR